MTPAKTLRNVPASVHARLLTLAHAQGRDFNLLLLRFAIERFLYRLSISDERDQFTLKGGTLLRVWDEKQARATRDVDFLAFGQEDHAAMGRAMEAICRAECPEDGVVFDPATVRISDIRRGEPQTGLRATIKGSLGRTRLHVQVDVGFADAVFPERSIQDFPTMLDLPVPRLWTYARETMVAEKFHAMVERGARNTRVRDLWDVPFLARRFPFDGQVLRAAIAQTFGRRGTKLAGQRPQALLQPYYRDARRVRLWADLREGMETEPDGPVTLADAGEELREFLGPVCDSLIEERPFTDVWPAGGPWRRGDDPATRIEA